MGGLREDTIESPAPAKKTKSGGAVTQEASGSSTIRFHEDPATGQVHFHDDANKLKVGVPVAEWYAAWRRISQSNNSTDPYTWIYYDYTNNSVLSVRTVLKQFGSPTLDIELTVAPLTFGPVYQQLERFIPKK